MHQDGNSFDGAPLHAARFIERPNRFLVRCQLGDELIEAYLPNPGRLWELLLPGSTLYVAEAAPSSPRTTRYTVIGGERYGRPVFLHTHHTNAVVEKLLIDKKIPGLEEYNVLRREVPFGRSRFDFLLGRGERRLLLEVKSCTLFTRRVAMFPDAPSARAKKHVEELLHLVHEGYEAAVLFLVQSSEPRFFLPDFHTDFAFAQELYEARGHLRIIPCGISWGENMAFEGSPAVLTVPWDIFEDEAGDRGNYIVLGQDGEQGWFGTAGWGDPLARVLRGLESGAALRRVPSLLEGRRVVLPIRGEKNREGNVLSDLALLADGESQEDGRRIFLFSGSPLRNEGFVEMLLRYRMDDLIPEDGAAR